ncbi:MAG: tRNA (adenosine(37)-N6)-threonylcarbamoyltransferase complex dimerization subunit type 1 TsaB [Clostridiales bacterium]|nr:tRNA (adenosine(37)-N6)-threonylcarbamoyltransferase complex dimerization subunit type 1 TsaB [Clostridiales bacterium]
MRILAFESSAGPASVALMEDGRIVAESWQNMRLTHSATLLPMAEDLLKNTGVTLAEIDMFAVAHGPGSFTGLRIGISTVKGLAAALEKPCVGVSTLEAMAAMQPDGDGTLCCVMDARVGQVYNALFDLRDGTRLCEDRTITLAELGAELHARGGRVVLCGDGAEIARDAMGVGEIAAEQLRWQRASGVAYAAREKQPISAAELTPVYHRLPQAERERLEKQNRNATLL